MGILVGSIVTMEICCKASCVLVVSLVLICEKLIKCLSRHAGTLLMLISGGKSLQCFMQFSVTPANNNNSNNKKEMLRSIDCQLCMAAQLGTHSPVLDGKPALL